MNATLMLGLALLVGAPIKDGPKKDEPTIVGEWVVESMVAEGMPAPKDELGIVFSFSKEGQLTVHENKGGKEEAGKYTIDLKKKPSEMDLIPPEKVKDKTILAIVKIEGDTLTICADRKGNRPTEFTSTPENKTMLLVLKRVKKEK
jgi:uncharacterized protein (TIGR03067 family)